MGILMDFEATCPVDGTAFTYAGTPGYSIFGRALDGLPRGSWRFPIELPQCPTCGLAAVFGDLTPDEAKRARDLIDSKGWREASDEAPYWRLSLAETVLGRGNGWTRVDRLLSATWQVYGDPVRYGRYARQLGDAMDAVADTSDRSEGWAMLQTFVANVERQAGDMKGAVARLDALEASGALSEEVVDRVAQTRAMIADGDRGGSRSIG